MGRVRPLHPHDATEVVDIFRQCFGGIARRPYDEVSRKFHEVFLEGPLAKGPLQSWVHEQDGDVTGFLGVLSIPYRMGDRKLTGACMMELMMSPDRPNARGALRLVRKAVDQGQDFSFANKATTQVQPIWRRHGGMKCWAYAFPWKLVLRPASLAVERAGSKLSAHNAWSRPALHAARSAAHLVDDMKPPAGHASKWGSALRARPATAESLSRAARETAHATLHYDFDDPSARWLLSYYADYPSRGEFCCRVLEDEEDRVQGFFGFMAGSHGIHEVLSLHARENAWPAVIEALERESIQRGGVQLVGQTNAMAIRHLVAAGGQMIPVDVSLFALTSDEEIKQCFSSGDFLRLGLEDESVF